MSHTYINRNKPAAAVLVLVLAVLGLSACGGSSNTSSSSTVASAATSTTPGGGGAARGGRFSSLRECLQKQGITLPRRSPGTPGAPGSGGLPGSGASRGPTLPSGVTRAQFEAAVKKCGGGNNAAGGRAFNSPARSKAFTAFAACMRANGVNLPAPNTSGNGPIFNTSGLNTNSAQFKGARAKCASALPAFAGGRASGGPPPSG
jgi:hypothetical protein